jgi:hypothetical protein
MKPTAYSETPTPRKCLKTAVIDVSELVSLLLFPKQERPMSDPRYLPAIRTKARSLRLGRLSVRTVDDRELGTLVGFLIDQRNHHIHSLVMEVVDGAGMQHVELPMVPLRLDAESHALRMVEPYGPPPTAFRAESVSQIDEDDLWIPFFHTAA